MMPGVGFVTSVLVPRSLKLVTFFSTPKCTGFRDPRLFYRSGSVAE